MFGLCSTLLHDLHDLQDSVHVLPGGDQTLKHQHPVVVEHVAVWTAHHLESRGLKGEGDEMTLTFSQSSTSWTLMLPGFSFCSIFISIKNKTPCWFKSGSVRILGYLRKFF